jgi:DNA invertase Pin-like site-specific DNA recombinase
VSDGFDLNGVCADVCIAVMSWAASMELQAKNERIAAARERVEAEGGSWGRPRRMNDDTVAKAVVLREAGRTIRQIAVALKVPRATVARTLASQKVRPQQAA